MSASSARVLRAIEAARKSNCLYLAGAGLQELPDLIGDLTSLRELYLSGNPGLRALPDSIEHLKSLRTLVLSGTGLKVLPDSITRLDSLRRLAVFGTGLEVLPDSIGDLAFLQELNLAGNPDLRLLPDSIGNLSSLRQLFLTRTGLTEVPDSIGNLGALRRLYMPNPVLKVLPHTLGNLRSLEELYLSGNPDLRELPYSIGNLTSLFKLGVSGTGLTDLPDTIGSLLERGVFSVQDLSASLPPELSAAAAVGLAEVVAFLRDRNDATTVVRAAKMVLVGDGEVGKSSLLATLRGEPWQATRSQTHGLEIKLVLVNGQIDGPEVFTLYGWDFGGQHPYRPANQVFFTSPAIYLLLWRPRIGARPSGLEDWLRIVRQRVGAGARVVVVATHSPSGVSPVLIDEIGLGARFSEMIVGFENVDSEEPLTVVPLKQQLGQLARALPQSTRRLPTRWLDAQATFESGNESTAYLPYEIYEQVAAGHGLDAKSARSLALTNHQLGRWVYYGDTPELGDVVIFQPDWLSVAIAAVIDEPHLGSRGLVLDSEMDALWARPTAGETPHPPEIRRLFARLMRRFELSYRVEPDDDVERTLIAQRVPGDRPEQMRDIWDEYRPDLPQRTLLCELIDPEDDRPARPEGLMYRLIVRLHRDRVRTSELPQGLHWTGGILVEDGYGDRALVTAEPEIGIRIQVRGPEPATYARQLEQVIVGCVRGFWKGVTVRTLVPCDASCETPARGAFDRAKLVAAKEHGLHEQQCPANGCDRYAPIAALLGDYDIASAAQSADLELLAQQLADAVRTDGERTRAVVTTHGHQSQRDVLDQINSAAALANDEFRRLRRLIGDDARKAPRLFLLKPLDRSLRHPSVTTVRMELSLCCEHSKLPLSILDNDPKSGVYRIDVPRQWWIKSAPAISACLKLVRAGVTMGVAATDSAAICFDMNKTKWAAEGERLKGYAEAIAADQDVLALMPNPDGDILGPAPVVPSRAEGADHRWLAVELDRVDPSHRWGGLSRVVASDHYEWVHAQFRNLYE